jgi:hypothetical protein
MLLVGWLTLAMLHGLDHSEEVKIQGLITGRTGDTLKVKTSDGNIMVALTDDKKVRKPKGLGLRKTQMSFVALIPASRSRRIGA